MGVSFDIKKSRDTAW